MSDPRRRPTRPHRHITQEQAERAIYLDFEGFTDKCPALVGYQVEDRFTQVVTDPGLTSAARTKSLDVETFLETIDELIRIARVEDRRIAAYSQHESNVIREHCDRDIANLYADGRMILRRWWNRSKPCPRPEEWSLGEFERCLGLKRPNHLRGGNATSRLRHVIDQLERRGAYTNLTRTAKAKWTNLLAYNERDVRNLRTLVLRAAVDLDPVDRARHQRVRRRPPPLRNRTYRSIPENITA